MKVTMYMAITANGYIARIDSGKIIGSQASWKRYTRMVRKFGNVIIGRKTFELMGNLKHTKGIGHPFAVAITRDRIKPEKNYAYASSPRQALSIMKKKGFKNVLVAGGATTNTMFMDANLVDEIYLEAEPLVLGRGITLFSESRFEKNIKLLGTKTMPEGAVLLHYRIKK